MDAFRKGWFTDMSPDANFSSSGNEEGSNPNSDVAVAWPGQAFSLEVDEVLFQGHSKFQDVLLFRSKSYGNVLVLDGVFQTTDKDEFAYQEMLTHLPLFSHPRPQRVLIIGGGDGGILREVLKHAAVESVVMCEIDEMVVNVAKKYLPKLSSGFKDPRLTLLHIGDGFEFLKGHKNEFDVVITDSSDPVGPAESLFGQPFYELIRGSLREGGVMACQCETIWLHLPLISRMLQFARELFPSVGYAHSSVPSYPCGSMGYLLACKTKRDLTVPLRKISDVEAENDYKLRYYSSSIHCAAFVLPAFAMKVCSHDSGC